MVHCVHVKLDDARQLARIRFHTGAYITCDHSYKQPRFQDTGLVVVCDH